MAKEWQLIRLDQPNAGDTFTAQFLPTDYTEEVSTTWASLTIPKRTAPVDQWIRGETETASFTARVWYDPAEEQATGFTGLTGRDPLSRVQRLKALIKPEAALGRPPKFRFVWGQIEFDCFVDSVGGVRYDEPRQDGSIQGATFNVRLRHAGEDLALVATDPSKPPPRSRYKPLVSGDTFESLAARQYDDPMLGVLLRQDSTLAFPTPGTVVRMERPQNYAGRAVVPQSYALSDADAAVARRLALLGERGASVVMPGIVQ